jgi:hypothetical protein
MDLCAKTLPCTHFTWTTSGSCALRAGSVYRFNATSVQDSAQYCGLVSDGVDWSATQITANNCDWDTKRNVNITTVRVEDAAACQAQCLNFMPRTPSCTHYTYSARTCWLKSGIVDKSTVVHTSVADMVCGYVSSGKKKLIKNHRKLIWILNFLKLKGVVWNDHWVRFHFYQKFACNFLFHKIFFRIKRQDLVTGIMTQIFRIQHRRPICVRLIAWTHHPVVTTYGRPWTVDQPRALVFLRRA